MGNRGAFSERCYNGRHGMNGNVDTLSMFSLEFGMLDSMIERSPYINLPHKDS